MPSINIGGFQIRIIPGDHAPAHVHVVGGSGEAIYIISPNIELRDAGTMNVSDRRKAAEAILSVHGKLMKLWYQYGKE
jgi:hypothetical protein